MRTKRSSSCRLPRQALPGLDTEISFLEGLVRRVPGYVDAMRILVRDYVRRGRLSKAIRLNERLAKLCPGDPRVHYRFACILSLKGEFSAGATALERAIDLGYRNFRWMAVDPDLGGLRRQPEYKRILVRVMAVKLAAL